MDPLAPYLDVVVTRDDGEVVPDLRPPEQLVDGGLMVLPVGPTDQQTLTTIEKREGRVVERPGIGVRFVKLIGQGGWPGDDDFGR